MIESLRIERLAVVERAELEFSPGLNVLTGETGAGKSIVLGALALLAGGRASSEAVRDGAEDGAVEALFRTDCHPDVERELEARGLAAEDHELVVRRNISRSGRSRTRLGGQLVPVSTLDELFGGRIEISSQHGSQSLLRLETHGQLLDAAGELEPLRSRVEGGFAELRALDAELESLRSAAEERLRRRDFLAFQRQEIDEAALEPGELARTEEEQRRLAHVERIREAGVAALGALANEPAGRDGSAGAADRLAEATRSLESVADLDGELDALAERVRGLREEVDDAGRDLERALSGLEADPARLARLEERMAEIDGLRRKYGADEGAILATRDEIAAELESIEGADARGEELQHRRERVWKALDKAARGLSRGRARAAKSLAEVVEKGLHELAMPSSRFEVVLEAVTPPEGAPCGPHGGEAVEFQFAANAGTPVRALRKVASGGELSRVFLAIKNALRRTGIGMVLVFDEVDAGIGGRTAERVGRILAELAEQHQVLCITHLPQIAAFAEAHFRVEKTEKEGETRTRVHRVEGDARIDEIARMAGGEKITDATRQHAESLLRSSQT